jgi:hypothetical protein
MKNKEEGNLLSFRIFFNKKGLLMSEYSTLPIKGSPKVFQRIRRTKDYRESYYRRIKTLR